MPFAMKSMKVDDWMIVTSKKLARRSVLFQLKSIATPCGRVSVQEFRFLTTTAYVYVDIFLNF